MSRSIHATRRSVNWLIKSRFADPAVHDELVEKEKDHLLKKRRAKRLTKEERHRSEPPLAGTPPELIPIEVLDESATVHHGASAEDIRAILIRLPATATEGIPRIQLCLGKATMEERKGRFDTLIDPLTKRIAMEMFPGVYCAPILGIRFHTGLIAIHAFVFEEGKLPLPAPVCALYLRLKALTVLVHEVAHHHDHQCRVARGRWVADRTETVEWYAEKMEYAWTQEIVIPYLLERYPRETAYLSRWTRRLGGIELDLKTLAGDPRNTSRSGPQLSRFSIPCAFETWVEELGNCKKLWESRLALAWEMYFANQYEASLEILSTIPGSNALRPEVRSHKGHTLTRLGRLDEAIGIAESMLVQNRSCSSAWSLRGDILREQKRWTELLSNCCEWENSAKLEKNDLRHLLWYQAVSYCALHQDDELENTLKKYLSMIPSTAIERIRHRILQSAGRA